MLEEKTTVIEYGTALAIVLVPIVVVGAFFASYWSPSYAESIRLEAERNQDDLKVCRRELDELRSAIKFVRPAEATE